MQTIVNCGLVGFGSVNKELQRILNERNWDVRWISRTAGLFDSSMSKLGGPEAIFSAEASRELDVVFLGLPSDGNGEAEVKFARHFLRQGIAVVTAGKSALACRPGQLRRYRKKFGYSATVGGNCGVLDAVNQDPLGIVEVVGIPNTTLNFLRDQLALHVRYDRAIEEARRLKFTENGNLQAELRDALLKLVILGNETAKLKTPLRFSDLNPCTVSDEIIQRLLSLNYVCVAKVSSRSVGRKPQLQTRFRICHCRRGEWRFELYFEQPATLPFTVPTGDGTVFNLTNGRGQKYLTWGKGAGARITAGTMFANAKALLNGKI